MTKCKIFFSLLSIKVFALIPKLSDITLTGFLNDGMVANWIATYNPMEDFVGSDAISYKVCNSNNPVNCSTTDGIIALTISPVNDWPEIISDFIRKWEEGYKLVIGVKTKSEESFIFLV